MLPDRIQTPKPVAHRPNAKALKRAGWSLLLPGLGQWLQGRPIAATLQLSTILLADLNASTTILIGIAIVARILSGLEAYQHESLTPPADEKP